MSNINVNFKLALSGEYKIKIIHNDGTVEYTDWFPNLILNQGLDSLAANSSFGGINYCRVGTGSSVPAATQVALDLQIASSAYNSGYLSESNSGSPSYSGLFIYEYTFAQGAVIGSITEIGVGWSSTGSTLFSRSLILDGIGNPTSITLTSVDQLTVYYRLTISPPLTDATGTVVIAGNTYNWTCRALSVGYYGNFGDAPIPSIASPYQSTAYIAGSSLASYTATTPVYTASANGNSSVSAGTYTSGTFQQTSVWTAGNSTANLTGGIQVMVFRFGVGGQYVFQMYFDTPITKDNTMIMTLTTLFSWGTP